MCKDKGSACWERQAGDEIKLEERGGIHQALIALRQEAGLRQADVVDRAGVGRNTVYRVERGHDVRWSTLHLLLQVYGYEVILRKRKP